MGPLDFDTSYEINNPETWDNPIDHVIIAAIFTCGAKRNAGIVVVCFLIFFFETSKEGLYSPNKHGIM